MSFQKFPSPQLGDGCGDGDGDGDGEDDGDGDGDGEADGTADALGEADGLWLGDGEGVVHAPGRKGSRLSLPQPCCTPDGRAYQSRMFEGSGLMNRFMIVSPTFSP